MKKKIAMMNSLINSNIFCLFGDVKVEHYKPSIFNPKKKLLYNTYQTHNGITNTGKNSILNIMFNDATQIANASWFIGLINNAGFSALAAADVANSHAGWTEFTGYSQATRVAWGSGTSTAQSTTNATPATFSITGGAATVNGIFVTSVSTKGGTTGTLWSTASFTAPVAVDTSDELKISYSVSA